MRQGKFMVLIVLLSVLLPSLCTAATGLMAPTLTQKSCLAMADDSDHSQSMIPGDCSNLPQGDVATSLSGFPQTPEPEVLPDSPFLPHHWASARLNGKMATVISAGNSPLRFSTPLLI